MKIKKIKIVRFRALKEAIVDCHSYNIFVGPNGVGKSTVLHALNIFFGDITSFSDDDFWQRETEKPIEISVVFESFSESARKDFKHYIRNDEMTVVLEIRKLVVGRFGKKVQGERLIFEPFKKFFELNKATASERKVEYESLKRTYLELPAASSDRARESALREYEENLDESKKIIARSGDSFFGATKGAGVIRKFVNWVYVPAVKEASQESEEAKSSHLGKLIQHTIRSAMSYEDKLAEIKEQAFSEYSELLKQQKVHLESLENRLGIRLSDSITSSAKLSLEWKNDESAVKVNDPTAQVLLSEKGFQGGVESFGHGLQRAFLIVILQELLEVPSEGVPTLILGCEEPELYQHPPQAKHLASVLMELGKGGAQVFVTSHSPYFVDAATLNGLKRIQNHSDGAKVFSSDFETIVENYNKAFEASLKNISQAKAKFGFQIQPKFSELFFCEKVVFVEGVSDKACLEAYLLLSEKKRKFQKKGISIIDCDGKSSLVLLVLLAKSFEIPFYAILDCDGNCTNARERTLHKADNEAAFALLDYNTGGPFPPDPVIKTQFTAWPDDIEGILDSEFGDHREECLQSGRNATGQLRNSRKNPLNIAATMSTAWDLGCRFPTFENLVEQILKD